MGMLKDKLHIDDKDVSLLSMCMKDPSVSQAELAHKLHLSQPSVNVRLRKLRERGVLVHAAGIDAKKAGVALVRVDFTCRDAHRILRLLQQCPFFINGFLLSGTRNVSVFLLGEDLGKIEEIVKQYLRVNPDVSNIEVSVVVDTAKVFICSVDLEKEHQYPCSNPDTCKDCVVMREA